MSSLVSGLWSLVCGLMKLLVTGGTGFIGRPLCRALVQQGHEPFVLTRSQGARAHAEGVRWLPWDTEEWRRLIGQVDGVVHLAGESLTARRWTAHQKRLIRDSRVETARRLVEAIAESARRPSVFVSGSAIGYYGARGDEPLEETAAPGRGFLAELCQAWEAQAQRADALGVRVVRLRIGVVLGRDGGALAKMATPFRLCVGGPLGSGRQWMSWIHLDDLVGLLLWSLSRAELSGAVNATAPEPVTMRALCREVGRCLRRPSWAPVPGVVLKLALGEMADMLLTGQRVLPHVALRAGYAFRYPQVPQALRACLR